MPIILILDPIVRYSDYLFIYDCNDDSDDDYGDYDVDERTIIVKVMKKWINIIYKKYSLFLLSIYKLTYCIDNSVLVFVIMYDVT